MTEEILQETKPQHAVPPPYPEQDQHSKNIGGDEPRQGSNKFVEKVLIGLSIVFTVVFFPISLVCIFVVVRQFERAVIFRNGKLYKNCAFGPGLILILPCVDTVKFADLRTVCYHVPMQEALTQDSLTLSVNAVFCYRISNPVMAAMNVTDYKKATQYLAATTLRNAVGSRVLADVLGNRAAVGRQIAEAMKENTRKWGVRVVRVELKDIRLPLKIQKAMAAEAVSSRLANAKLIVAKSEIENTKSLQKATAILMDNPMCMQLRYLQSLNMLTGDKTHTIVFPFPVEQIKKIFS